MEEKFEEGQVFTVAKLHYINGVVYLAAQKGTTGLQTLADNYTETTKYLHDGTARKIINYNCLILQYY